MGFAGNLIKLNIIRKGIKNLPKSRWFWLTSLLGGTRYGKGIGRAVQLYYKVRMLLFVLYALVVVFLAVVILALLSWIIGG